MNWIKIATLQWPPGSGNEAGKIYTHKLNPNSMKVIISKALMQNGDKWLHLSVSRTDRLPSWDEMKKIQSDFFGDDFEMVHMLPKKKDYVNIHSYCLHLWAPIGAISDLPNLHKLKHESVYEGQLNP